MIESLLSNFSMLLPGFGVAVAVAWTLVHTRDLHVHLTGDHPDSGPQKLHTVATPRVGGLAVMSGLLAGLIWLYFTAVPPLRSQLDGLHPVGLLAGLLPLFVLGLLEDIWQTVSVRLRLAVSLASGALAYGMAGLRVVGLGLPGIDAFIQSQPLLALLFPMFFTLVAVAGLVHAMNIVDGLNGLLAGITLVILGVLATVAARFDEAALVLLALSGMAATAGFAVFNFPRARLFCGEGGAYLLGYLVAVIVILLVLRQPTISPWFALAVVIHPVTETLYSAWRRFRLGLSPTHPDARHMHSLWAGLLQRRSEETGVPIWLGPNAAASWRTWAIASLPVLLAGTCPTQAMVLQVICAIYVALFILTVRTLERPVFRQVSVPYFSDDRKS